MSDLTGDNTMQIDSNDSPSLSVTGTEQTAPDATPQEINLVKQIIQTIKADKRHHKIAFDRMRHDMQIATWGADKTWIKENYVANIAGRHIRQKTAALYAKNPKVSARRREQIDFAIWDENPQSLMIAMQTVMAGQAAVQAAATTPAPMPADPMAAPAAAPGAPQEGWQGSVSMSGTPGGNMDPRMRVSAPTLGHNGGPALPPVPQMPPGFDQAMALVADFQQGLQRRQMYDKIGKTLEILFATALANQQPIDFKRGMKAVVRRALTTGVAYVELGFQREMGPRAGLTEQLADARVRLDHLKSLSEEVATGEYDEDSAEKAELELSMASLQAEPEIVLREGLIIDYPMSTKVIPDKLTKQLDGFVGARHLTIEYAYSVEEVEEIFGVDMEDGYTSYETDDATSRDAGANTVHDDNYIPTTSDKKGGMVCVWKHYDKPTGLVYYVADGYKGFLRPPAAPDVFVENFWPVYALTFNATENEHEVFPPSDVSLLMDMQKEYNRSRQGLREHREAARPRWVAASGAFASEEDPLRLKTMKPFELAMLGMAPGTKISDILQVIPVPGVDPNLYETGPIFTDTQLVVGAQEAQFGGVSKATATEAAIASNSSTSADASSIDDLDAFLSAIARAGGQIMQREMSEEIVKQIVGPGAVWPQMTLAEIAGEIHLEVAAGSTGKPNQAVEIANMEKLLPLLIQMPSINQEELAREVLRRLDDRMDLTKMIVANAPSIVSQNQNAQPSPANPGNNPAMQGAHGANNAPAAPGGPGGSSPAFGSNQT